MRAILAAVFAASVFTITVPFAAPAQADEVSAPTRGEIQHVEREIPVRGRGNIRGRLMDPAGRGVRGVIWLCSLDGTRLSQWDSTMLRDGQFFMDNLAPGRYLLHVDSIGPDITDMLPPEDKVVEVKVRHNTHPELVTRTHPRISRQ